jgi:hypothetical protein
MDTQGTVTTNLAAIQIDAGALLAENAVLKEKLSAAVMFKGDLMYQQYIEGPPVANKEQLYERACTNDGVTVKTWIDTWLKHVKMNTERYDVKTSSVMSVFGTNGHQPCIIAGSGPSLKKNAVELTKRKGICLVSCLHNFGYLEDIGAAPEYYLNLDAGEITIPEVFQGGKKEESYYWDATKDRTLLTSLTGNPALHEKWKGKILWFNVVAPDPVYLVKLKEITDFNVCFSVGGNALGACLYFAKAILGSNPLVFVGADFSFSYSKKFHPFDSPYDKQFSGIIPATDVFGHRVYTWPSYFNFKCWFDYTCCGGKVGYPGQWINCTEGGILGAYPEGNIRQIQQMQLAEFLMAYNGYSILPEHIDKIWKEKNEYAILF